LATYLAMKLVAFRDPAWARMIGSLLGGSVDYVFSSIDALNCAAKRKPHLIFLSSYLADPAMIAKLLQRSPQSLVVYVTRCLTNRQRQAALDSGAYEALDYFTEDFPHKVAAVVEVAAEVRGATSSSTLPQLAPVLRLLP